MRYAAARASADSPVRNAATRTGEGALVAGRLDEASLILIWSVSIWSVLVCSVLAMAVPRLAVLGEFKRARIDFAARPARKLHRVRHGILDAAAFKLASQQIVQYTVCHDLRIGRGRADHQHEF